MNTVEYISKFEKMETVSCIIILKDTKRISLCNYVNVSVCLSLTCADVN